MPKQFFGKSFGDSGFKTIVTKDSKNAETGHISSEIIEQLTLKADDGAYISSDPSTGEILLSSALSWGDTGDGERIKMFQDRDKMTSDGSLAFEEGGGVFRKINGVPTSISPGFIGNGDSFPNSSRRGTFWMNSANQLFVNAGGNQWLRLGSSIVSTQNPNLWNESGAHMTSVADINNYYANSNVEDILAEMADRMPLYFTRRDNLAAEGVSGGHLVASKPGYVWDTDKDNINELQDPNGSYYINRKKTGIKLGQTSPLTFEGAIYDNENEFTAFIKHNVAGKGLQVDELATVKETRWLIEQIGHGKLAIPDNEDIWSEVGLYTGNVNEIQWLNSTNKGTGILDEKGIYSLDKKAPIAHRLPLSGMRPRYNVKDEISEYNYIYRHDQKQPYSMNPLAESYDNSARPAFNVSLKRYIENNDYYTGSSYTMDLNTEQNKNGFEIHNSERGETSRLPVGASNVFSVKQTGINIGDDKYSIPSFNINSDLTSFKGKQIIFGDDKTKMTFNGNLLINGGLSQGSDLYFDILGVKKATDGDMVDKSVVNIGFVSTDDQIRSFIRADSRNGDKGTEQQSNMFVTDNRGFNYYGVLGKFGIFDDLEGSSTGKMGRWFLKHETTYDFEAGTNAFERFIEEVKELDEAIANEKDVNKKNKLIEERRSLLYKKQRAVMTTLGAYGQTLIKSIGSKVVLRSDYDGKSDYYNVKNFHDTNLAIATKSYTGFTVFNGMIDAALMMGACPSDSIASPNLPEKIVGSFLISQSRNPGKKLKGSANLRPLFFLSDNQYHNLNGGAMLIDNGILWTTNKMCVGAKPVTVKQKVPGETNEVTVGQSIGGSSQLRLYPNRAGSTQYARFTLNDDPKNNYDKGYKPHNEGLLSIFLVQDDYENNKDKSRPIDLNIGRLFIGGERMTEDHSIRAEKYFVFAGKNGLSDSKEINLITYIKGLESRIAKLEGKGESKPSKPSGGKGDGGKK